VWRARSWFLPFWNVQQDDNIIFDGGISQIEEVMTEKSIPFHIEHVCLDGFLRELKRESGSSPYWMMPYGDFGQVPPVYYQER